jgi:hypothetical protein
MIKDIQSLLSRLVIAMIFITSASYAFAQPSGTTLDSLKKEKLDWFSKDIKADKIAGASVNKAYTEFLKGRKASKKVIVAVIDSGVDVDHEDLKGKIWINSKEIAGNGLDDDNNGYPDDINGWNFLGNRKGENINFETYEFTRIYRDLKPVYEKLTDLSALSQDKKIEYNLYLSCKKEFEKQVQKYQKEKEDIAKFETRIVFVEEILKRYTTTSTLTKEVVQKISTTDEQASECRRYMLYLFDNGYTNNSLKEIKDHTGEMLDKHLSLDFKPRMVIGDNPKDFNDNSQFLWQ